MPDSSLRSEPLPPDPLVFTTVVLSVATPSRRFSLRARDPAVLARVIGYVLPERIGETRDGIACLGPDEYYARLAPDADLPRGAGQPVSVTDVSDRAVGIVVDGPGALDLLSTRCPLDLAGFAIGRTTRTIFETVEVIITREAETRWHVEVWRSFAPWLWRALATAAKH